MGQAIKTLSNLTDKPIGGYANSENIISTSEIEQKDHKAEELQQNSSIPLTEEEYTKEVLQWINSGATIVGGCCRTRPSYIKHLRKLIDSNFS